MSSYFKQFVEEAEKYFVKPFVVTDNIRNTITRAISIVHGGDPEIDNNKGLLIANPKYGMGKTFFFEVLHFRHLRRFNRNLYKKTSAKELVTIYKDGGEDALLEFIRAKNLFIDDIGDEGEKTVSHYKNSLNVVRFVLLKRYDMWRSKGWKLYGTTNLTIDGIADEYDGRVADRILEMCYIETFDFMSKGSFRQNKSVKIITPQERKALLEAEKPVEKVEKVDLKEYLNKCLNDSDNEIKEYTTTTLNFIKDLLLRFNYISPDIFRNISEADIERAEILAKKDVMNEIKTFMANSDAVARSRELDLGYKKIDRKKKVAICESIIVREKLLEFKKIGYVFE